MDTNPGWIMEICIQYDMHPKWFAFKMIRIQNYIQSKWLCIQNDYAFKIICIQNGYAFKMACIQKIVHPKCLHSKCLQAKSFAFKMFAVKFLHCKFCGQIFFCGITQYPLVHRLSWILNRLRKIVHSAASHRKRKDSLPPLACTQQAYGEKEHFAWTGNFLKMPHTSKKIIFHLASSVKM